MGDPQCGLEGWGRLLKKARERRPDASALLIAGDLVDRGNERTNWDHFFLRAAGVFEGLPVMPAVGNHEYLDRGPWLFRTFFDLPANGPEGVSRDLVYSFELADAFVAVLDSTLAVSDPGAARLQAEWLDQRLASTSRRWKLVMFHHPVYASHPNRESPSLRDAWVSVFDRHHVDLVIQGHDHAYLRTYPMRGGRRTGSPAEGTVYTVSVSGDKFYDQDPREYTEVGFTHVSTYQTIDIQPCAGRLVYKAFDSDGRERDGFVIEKRPDYPEVTQAAGR
jgi:3',5'-cyclic AMP phosphodiesterase CpdA